MGPPIQNADGVILCWAQHSVKGTKQAEHQGSLPSLPWPQTQCDQFPHTLATVMDCIPSNENNPPSLKLLLRGHSNEKGHRYTAL